MTVTQELAHREDGNPDGPPVLLGPSLGTTLEMWDLLAAALSPGFRVVRFDTRGHGGSPVPPGPYTMDELAADVAALADRLGLDRFAFVGISLGGAVGQTLALEHPHRLTALVLCCTGPKFGDPGVWRQRATQVRAEGMGFLAEPTRERWFSPEFAAAEPAEVDRLIGMLTASPPVGYAACCDALSAYDTTDRLGDIAAPTRVVSGTLDPTCPPSVGEVLADRIPGADHVVLDGVAHIANVGAPDRFNAAVLEHLEKHA